MTTIVWDGKHLYADSQVTADDMKGTMTKAVRVQTPGGPVFAAVCGEVHVLKSVVAALKSGEAIEPLVGEGSTILLVKDGNASVVTGKESWPQDAPIFLGSGAGIARGAYHVSKSAAKAVAAACAIDLYSSAPIVRLKTS